MLRRVLMAYVASTIGCGSQVPSQVEVTATPAEGYAESAAPAADFRAPATRFALDPGRVTDRGQGPGLGGDKYDLIVENGFVPVQQSPLSTFSIDVDTASYSKMRMCLLQQNTLPPADAVRIEELLNYFDYDYSPPVGEHPFSVHVEVAETPWRPGHQLARVGLQGRKAENQRPASNLVFLLDVSGSMDYPNKLPLVKQGLRTLTSQLTERDRVAIVVYAGAAGLVLPSTRGDDKHRILAAFEELHAGGSTNGGQGIQLAYEVARQNFIPGGVNRILLCTDGDFNVGTTSTGELVRWAEEQAQTGVFLSVLGFGMGNHNDAMLEELSNRANGNYAFIDTPQEAQKVLGEQVNSTLVTIAKDVKIQVEFNPAHVAAYRLIGYENRRLEAHEFNDDQKDAGEIGAGHSVTALYELVLVGTATDTPIASIDPLKYQQQQPLAAGSDELMTVKLRYKEPLAETSKLLVVPVRNNSLRFGQASGDFQFASAVAAFGMLLRQSAHRGEATYASVLEIAQASCGKDQHGYRAEFLQLVSTAARLSGEPTAFILPPRPEWTGRSTPAPTPVVVHAASPPRSLGQALLLPLIAAGLLIGTLVLLACTTVAVLLCQRRLVLVPAAAGPHAWPCIQKQHARGAKLPPVRSVVVK